MDRLKTMQSKVEWALENKPDTRDDDRLLVCVIYARFYNVNLHEPFQVVMTNEYLPNFETIRRCRQKAQELHPALRGKKDSERLERQKEFVEYATEGK